MVAPLLLELVLLVIAAVLARHALGPALVSPGHLGELAAALLLLGALLGPALYAARSDLAWAAVLAMGTTAYVIVGALVLFGPPAALAAAALLLVGGFALVREAIHPVMEGSAHVTTLFGRYCRTLRPGLNLLLPGERVLAILPTAPRAFTAPPQRSTYRAGETRRAVATVRYQVIADLAHLAAFAAADWERALCRTVTTLLREEMAWPALGDDGERLRRRVDAAAAQWGVHVISVTLRDLMPSGSAILDDSASAPAQAPASVFQPLRVPRRVPACTRGETGAASREPEPLIPVATTLDLAPTRTHPLEPAQPSGEHAHARSGGVGDPTWWPMEHAVEVRSDARTASPILFRGADAHGPEQGGMRERIATHAREQGHGVGGMGNQNEVPSERLVARREARRHPVPVWMLCALLLASLLLGYGGASTVFGLRDALVVARDAQAHATVLEALLKGGGLTQVETLHAMQTQLRAIDRDLRLVRADLPVEPVLERLPGASGAVHGLLLATDLVEAGELGVDAALALVPHLKALLSSVGGAATPSSGSGPPTLAEIRRAAADVDAAGRLAVAAVGERAHVGDGDLRALGLGKLIPRLHQLDGLAPQLPTYLGDAHAALAALPALIGIPKPINFLLFDVDSDELRATGGFQGVYGVLTFSQGALAGGVHLTDIYSLDCAGGYCPTRWVPGRFAWFDTDPSQFALRDANQDPDYPTTARFDEQLFAQEGGPPVAGVLSITPAFVEQILRLTGPISVPQFGQTVTADNLQELIHHYHAAAAVAGNDATRKVFDADAGSALLKAVATLTPAQQGQLVQRALKDLRTRDIQVYLNDARLEGVLAALGADGALLAPKGDALAVVDTNVGASYANADVRETVADAISLDARGTATHDLTITYDLPFVLHSYPPELSTIYVDVLRVIVPAGARLSALDGCDPVTTTQAGHAVWACRFVLEAGRTLRVHLRWTATHVAARVASATQYALLLQQQAGARDDVEVTIAPPKGSALAPPPPPLTANRSKQAIYTGPLTENQPLVVRYTP